MAINTQSLTIEGRLIGSPKTSVSDHLTLRINPEDGRIRVWDIFPQDKVQ
jgi:hypothetical protein